MYLRHESGRVATPGASWYLRQAMQAGAHSRTLQGRLGRSDVRSKPSSIEHAKPRERILPCNTHPVHPLDLPTDHKCPNLRLTHTEWSQIIHVKREAKLGMGSSPGILADPDTPPQASICPHKIVSNRIPKSIRPYLRSKVFVWLTHS